MNIKTNYDFPPIPIRNFDWSAWNDDTYDEDSIIGHGKTELDAINNLIEMIEGNVSAPINEVKEDKGQDIKPFDFNQLDSDIKRMFPIDLKAKIKHNIAGMCHNDLAAEKASEKCIEVTMEHLGEKIKNLLNKYGENELGKMYNLAVNDVLNLLK